MLLGSLGGLRAGRLPVHLQLQPEQGQGCSATIEAIITEHKAKVLAAAAAPVKIYSLPWSAR